MNLSRLILRSLRHYWRAHLGLLSGTALATAVISGSLILGDSVTASLGSMANQRLGKIRDALVGSDRFFTAALATSLGEGTHMPAILAHGTASADGGKKRVNHVQVIGITADFGLLSNAGAPLTIAPGHCLLSRALAERLDLTVGDLLLVRMEKPGLLPKDAPLSGSTENDLVIRAQVAQVLDNENLGSFKATNDQLPALNIFLSLAHLQAVLDQPERANLILSTGIDQRQLAQAWTPADLGLSSSRLADGTFEIRSARVFMDPAVEQALINLVQAGNVRPLLTYLVHAISSPGSTTVTPNSMVTATEGIVPDPPPGSTLPPAAIIQWLADDLGIGIGDTVSLRYLVPATGSQRKLAEKSAEFVVTRILPMTANEVDDSWMPAFPGITDADNCRDWDPGFEIDLGAIREKDEAYWRTHRGTPKVFLQLDDGTRLWRNRYGKSTGIRFSRPPEDLTGALRERITPAAVGISVETLRQDADAAVRDALPLGTYFLYFGWFILVAAVMLAALLFLFALESRSAQLGLQKAVGLPESITRIAVLVEAALVTLLGSLCGIGLGTVYARACLWGLTHLWQDATGAIPWVFHLQPLTALGGALLAVLFSLAVVTFAGRGLFRKSPRQLLSGAEAAAFSRDHAISTQSSRCRVSAAAISAMLALAGAAGALLISRTLSGPPLAGAFFGAGALLLVAGISVLAMILRHLDRPREAAPGSIVQLGIRNLVRRPGRALTVTGLVASAVFLVASVNAFRLDASSDASFRSSGTGGFALVGESSLPIYHDPGSAAGQLALGFDPGELDGVAIVPLRSLPGDDASCLNLNRAQRPTLLGIDPSELATRQAFTFTSGEQNWASLNGLTEAGNIPAIVDQNTANYALGKKIGDCLVYTDEQGEQFNIEIVGTLAGSILQGRVILCAEHFTRHFPSAAGYHSFLVDIGPGAGDQNAIASLLARQLASRGLALQSAADRLDEFHAVQNSYLGIFTALGGLGVVIGTLGLGAVVARQLLERRGELSLMRALGFTATRIRLLILSEHIALLVFSITLGLATAFIAIWPQLASPGSGINLSGIFLFSALSLLLGVASIAAASVRLPDLRTSLQSE